MWHLQDLCALVKFYINLTYQSMKVSTTCISHLNNYFDFHVCLSFRPFSVLRPCVRKLTSIPAVVQQNVMNKSCLVCVTSEKYAIWVTLKLHSDCCCRGEAKVHTLCLSTKCLFYFVCGNNTISNLRL